MCAIAGFLNYKSNYLENEGKWKSVISDMRNSLRKRDADEYGDYLTEHLGLTHSRPSVRDLKTGKQPIIRKIGDSNFAIAYNGELYNTDELKKDLLEKGYEFSTTSDTEVILYGCIHYGIDFINKMNGIFSIAYFDDYNKTLYLIRDRAGAKPLFYTMVGGSLVFGCEIKAILEFPNVERVIDRQGLCEVFAIGPARTHGVGIFKDINEVKPGHFIVFNENGIYDKTYWDIESHEHTDSYEQTIEKTKFLVTDAVERQMVSDVPICSFLSGGLDSSVVTAIANRALVENTGNRLDTFSFDFKGNSDYFKSSSFQPDQDRPWVDRMVSELGTDHNYLECNNEDLADYLYKAVDAKDLPCMADVESSLLYFCEKVKEYNKVALTGECADEIFGGYPWFHKKEMFLTDMFPWSSNLKTRSALLNDDVKNKLNIDEYAQYRYDEAIKNVPVLEGEIGEEKRRRELSYLNIKWFMSTLLDRMDRVSMYSGLKARVPYADHRIIEYVFNVPWDIKCKDGMVKHLLRKSMEGILPDDILYRKKSPYPKTYNPGYEKILSERLMDILNSNSSPILEIVDKYKISKFIKSPSDYGKPWFGQLMAGPQMMAYLIQINYWLKKYSISIRY